MKTLGMKISSYRKLKGMTQEGLAASMNVTPQAVSKWENDWSIPELPLLLDLADLFGVTLDALVREDDTVPVAQLLPEAERKPSEQTVVRIRVDTATGDNIRLNLPLAILKSETPLLDMAGIQIVDKIDWEKIVALAEQGVTGTLVEVTTGDGHYVEITVE